MSSDDSMIWPVTDAQIDKDELEAMDGVDLSLGSIAGRTMSMGSNAINYSGYTQKTYVEQEKNDEGVDTVAVKGNLTISEVDGSNKIDVGDFMKTVQDRMLILQPNFEAMEEYPALKDAYDQYKMLEKLLMDRNNAKKD